jgi:hypothetical protein
MMTRTAALLAVLVAAGAVLGAPPARGRKVDEKAMKMLEDADKQVYRPLEHGLSDISFEFDVMTKAGKLTCLYMYRAATPERPAREKWTVKNVEDRAKRRAYAAGLREYHDIVIYPLQMQAYAAEAKDKNVLWKDSPRGGMTVIEAPDPAQADVASVSYLWGADGMPAEITRVVWQEDPDEGRYKEEFTATCEWRQYGKYRALTLVNSDFTGFRILAKYEYAEVKGILLPSSVTRINPMEGEDELPLRALRVNEGIPDEEFSKW